MFMIFGIYRETKFAMLFAPWRQLKVKGPGGKEYPAGRVKDFLDLQEEQRPSGKLCNISSKKKLD